MSNATEQFTTGQQLKLRWRKEGKGLSLKQFARKLVDAGDSMATTWFDMKKGLYNQTASKTKTKF